MGNFRKQTKHFKIGNYDFTLGINRDMAFRFFQHQPKILDCANKMQKLQDKITNQKDDSEMSSEEYFAFTSLYIEMQKYIKEIVDYALPEMLLYGGMLDCSTKQYADSLIAFCEENDILYDETTEDENGQTTIEKGVYSFIMEFIQLGFTGGKGMPNNKKPKVKIVVN